VKPRDTKKTEKIYKATLQLVMEKGVAGITMSDIARKAKMATGTLYIYFKNKEDLVNALFIACRTASAGIYFTDYDPGASFKECFKTIWMNILRHRTERFEEAVFLEQCYHSPFVAEGNKETSKQLFQPLFALMERGKKEKIIKETDTIMQLTFMIGSINEMVKYLHYHKRTLTKPMTQSAFEMCWDGLSI
jgi:AcrR family transcriptional regulator